MEIVPDYFFSQCSFEEQFIQITKYKIWYRPTSLFKVNFCYIYKNYLHKTQLFFVYAAVFNAQGDFAAGQNHPKATNQCLNAPS